MPGWFPDPGGAPDRYRYWDGTGWSVQLTDDPRQPAPGPASTPVRQRRSRLGLIIGLLAGVVILVVVGTLIIGNLPPTLLDPIPTSSGRAGDDSSPTATASPASPPTPTPTPPRSPSPSPRTPAPLAPCPVGHPEDRADHPNDERVYGGNLSFAAEPTLEPATIEPRLSIAYDVVQQTFQVNDRPSWIAELAVGRLRDADGFANDPRKTVESAVRCVVTGDLYSPYHPTRHDLRSSSVIIDKREGWLIESEIRVDQPGLAFPGDHMIVIVVRDRDGWGMFFGAVPIGDSVLNDIMSRAVASLRAS